METQIDQIINVGHHQRRRNRTLLGLVGAGILLVGAIFGSAATGKGWFKNSEENKVPIYVSSDAKVNENITINGGFSAIAKAITPAVVVINVLSRKSPQQMPFLLDPFGEFFDRPDQDDEGTPRRRIIPRQPQQREDRGGRLLPSGTGSGVIVSPDGYIITNNHVVEGADEIKVELADRRQFSAKSIGTDPRSDLAVIKIEGGNFPTATLGDSNKAEVGDIVLAIGNPLGIGQTVTMGIISAKGRTTARSPDPNNAPYEDFLQTDASINQGNSGGALVNLRGELIGIPSQILSRTGGSIGIGFAIPANQARSVMDQLIKSGKVRRGKLGVIVQVVTPEYADQFGYKGTEGAFVQDVVKGDPADQAGVKPGDIITEFQGQRIIESSQLRNLASNTAPGTTVKFKVWRDGAERELNAKLAEVDSTVASKNTGGGTESSSASGLLSGIRVENLTPENLRASRLPENTQGVVIVEVDPESNAAFAGLRRGNVIEEIAKQPVTNVGDFNAAVQKLGGKKSVLLRIRDSSGGRFVVVGAQD
jgi:Do/DeqQ family serine protease